MSEWKSKANWKDRKWKYKNSASTDISKTIARVKREMEALAELDKQEREEKVRPLKVANKK